MDKFDSSTIKAAEVTAKILAPLIGTPSELSFKEASPLLFHGRPLRWVKVYITSKYPEVTEGPEAWMTQPRGTGHPVRVIDPIKASVWMMQHGNEIPWDSDFPETVEAHRNDGGARRPYQDYPENANGRRPYHIFRTGKNENADLKAYHDTY